MKKIIKTTMIILFIGTLSCQVISAQPQPKLTNKYTNDQIEGFIQQYRTSHSKDIRPSDNFQQQLTKDFPNAKDIDWETAAEIYEVEFEIGRTDYKAFYDNNANLLMYILEIREADIPAIVKNTASSKYPNYKIEDSKKIVKSNGVFYTIEMEKNDMEIKATYNENGTFIKEILD